MKTMTKRQQYKRTRRRRRKRRVARTKTKPTNEEHEISRDQFIFMEARKSRLGLPAQKREGPISNDEGQKILWIVTIGIGVKKTRVVCRNTSLVDIAIPKRRYLVLFRHPARYFLLFNLKNSIQMVCICLGSELQSRAKVVDIDTWKHTISSLLLISYIYYHRK
mmetsp:Transcript_30327/g.46448  ORF Transcript_30327/g.46448 Transcript_30327/m.46448 type:complete len:164 (-) Transcript_30327:858-1349(-)